MPSIRPIISQRGSSTTLAGISTNAASPQKGLCLLEVDPMLAFVFVALGWFEFAADAGFVPLHNGMEKVYLLYLEIRREADSRF